MAHRRFSLNQREESLSVLDFTKSSVNVYETERERESQRDDCPGVTHLSSGFVSSLVSFDKESSWAGGDTKRLADKLADMC